MKTQLLLILCCFSFFYPIQAQQTIHYPVYTSRSTTGIEITRIEISPKGTILHAEVYNEPGNWVRLSPGTTLHGATTGKDYKLLFSEGFELGQKVTMPANGSTSFTLTFEPLDKKEQAIDFVEGKADGDYVINGLQLNENYKKQPIRCHLSGTVIDRPNSSRLMLTKAFSDTRTSSWLSIPIHNGKFEYDLYTDTSEKYELIFWDEQMRGAWRPVPFFAENGKVEFTLYPIDRKPKSYEIKTNNPLTREMTVVEEKEEKLFSYDKLNEESEALEKAGNYYTQIHETFWAKFTDGLSGEERDKLFKERDQLEESGAFYTEAAKDLRKKYEALDEERQTWLATYAKQHPSIFGLSMLIENTDIAIQRKKDITRYINVYDATYAKQFPKHPYHQKLTELFYSHKMAGKHYIDFSAPDLNGNLVTISNEISNKIALIDFWASWCGPCRRSSKSMIPVYEKYHNKGFTIIGIARESPDTKAMEKAIQKDGYPWKNLVELNDQAQIWNKYGLSRSAGGTFLVDRNGIVLAVDPTADEVEAILQKQLKD